MESSLVGLGTSPLELLVLLSSMESENLSNQVQGHWGEIELNELLLKLIYGVREDRTIAGN